MHPILFQIGPVTIYTYGFFVFLGVLAGFLVSVREARRQGIDKKVFSDIFFWVIVISFITARILYIIVELPQFLTDPLSVIFSRSGFVFYGGVIGGISALYFFARKNKLSFLVLCDIFTFVVPLGHALGRLGCFSYGCCYGKPTRSFLGVMFPPESPAGVLGTRVFPVQLFEAGALLLLFFSLLRIQRKKSFKGHVTLFYVLFYGLIRFILEFFRGDPRGSVLGLSTSQIIALVMVVASMILWFFLRRGARKSA